MTIPDRNVFLYAVFVKPSIQTLYSVDFLANNATDEPSVCYEGQAEEVFELPSCMFDSPSHVFSHWTDGISDYYPGDTYTMPDHDVTFTAVWKAGSAAFIPGDVNDDTSVTSLDRLILTRYLAGWQDYEDKVVSKDAADLNGDGKISAMDRLILSRHLAGWPGYETIPLHIDQNQ